MDKKNIAIIVLYGIGLLTFIAYLPFLPFTFWRDDWGFYWGAIHNDRTFLSLLVHPGTMIEFFLLSRIFRTTMYVWNAFGLILKLIATYSVYRLGVSLLKNKTTALFAGILFLITPLGLEGVVWSSAHITLIDSICVCLALDLCIQYQKTKSIKKRNLSIAIALVGIVLDPIRVLPFVVIVGLYQFLFHSVKIRKKYLLYAFGLVFVLGSVAMSLNSNFLQSTRIIEAANRHGLSFSFYVSRGIDAGVTYFSSVGNIIVGWLIGGKDVAGDMQPSIWLTSIGIISFSLWCFLVIKMYKRLSYRTHSIKIFAFLFAWVMLFYIPNWVFTLVVGTGFTSRYVVISSVAVALFFAYVVTAIPKTLYRNLVFAGIILLNVITLSITLSKANIYRNPLVLETLAKQMDADVPKDNKQYLFIITGIYPGMEQEIYSSRQLPFVLKRGIRKREEFPIVVHSEHEALQYMCGDIKETNAVSQNIPVVSPILFSDVYQWYINENGEVFRRHDQVRESLKNGTQSACPEKSDAP